jgi:hypothetical protein
MGAFAVGWLLVLLKNKPIAEFGHRHRHILRSWMYEDVSDARVVICLFASLMLTGTLVIVVIGVQALS